MKLWQDNGSLLMVILIIILNIQYIIYTTDQMFEVKVFFFERNLFFYSARMY